LLHLSKEGNFQTETEATVVGCSIVNDCDEMKDRETGEQLVVEIQLDVTSMHPQGEVCSSENARNQIPTCPQSM